MGNARRPRRSSGRFGESMDAPSSRRSNSGNEGTNRSRVTNNFDRSSRAYRDASVPRQNNYSNKHSLSDYSNHSHRSYSNSSKRSTQGRSPHAESEHGFSTRRNNKRIQQRHDESTKKVSRPAQKGARYSNNRSKNRNSKSQFNETKRDLYGTSKSYSLHKHPDSISLSGRTKRRSSVYVEESFSGYSKKRSSSNKRIGAGISVVSIFPKNIAVIAGAIAILILVFVVAFNVYAGEIEKQRPSERLTSPTSMPTKLINASYSLIDAFQSLDEATQAFVDAGSSVGYFVQTVSGTPILSHNADKKFYSASSIKGPYVLSVFSSGIDDISNSTKSLVEDTIIESSNEAYYAVKDEYGVSTINGWLAETNASEAIGRSAYSFLNISPRELAALWQHAWEYVSTSSDTQEWLQVTFAEPKNSVIAELPDAITWSKPGWIVDDSFSCTVDAGIVERNGCAYIVSVMTDKGFDFSLVDDMVKAIDAYILAMPESLIEVDVAFEGDSESESGSLLVADADEVYVEEQVSEAAKDDVDMVEASVASDNSNTDTSTDNNNDSGPTYKLTVRNKD